LAYIPIAAELQATDKAGTGVLSGNKIPLAWLQNFVGYHHQTGSLSPTPPKQTSPRPTPYYFA